MKTLWTFYDVTFSFLDKLCASVPANPELTKIWLESRQPRVKPPGGRSIDEVAEEVASTLLNDEEEATPSVLVFQRIDGHLVMRAGTIRAHIKDCARVISAQYVGKIKGERSFATKVLNGVYTEETEYWLPILDGDEKSVKEPSGIHEKPIRFRLPDGSYRSAIKMFEFIEHPFLKFKLKVLGNSPNAEDIETIFTYGAVHGYGGERGDGEGKYKYTIKKENHNERNESSTNRKGATQNG